MKILMSLGIARDTEKKINRISHRTIRTIKLTFQINLLRRV